MHQLITKPILFHTKEAASYPWKRHVNVYFCVALWYTSAIKSLVLSRTILFPVSLLFAFQSASIFQQISISDAKEEKEKNIFTVHSKTINHSEKKNLSDKKYFSKKTFFQETNKFNFFIKPSGRKMFDGNKFCGKSNSSSKNILKHILTKW